MREDGREPIIEMKDIVKSFYGVRALDCMALNLHKGEIHGLVGENGAGKSTLMKILSGAYTPDSGEIYIDGNPHKNMTSELSKELGIAIIYQENLLVPWMNIVENIFIGQEISKGGFVMFQNEYAKAKELCDTLDIQLNLNKTIDKLSVAEQQFVKIIKALSTNPRILVMDEPTSMFNSEDASRVLKMVESIAKQGVSIIYISHFLKEVKQICDRITVIRDGAPIRVYDNANRDVNLEAVVNDMVGRDTSLFYKKEEHEIGDKAFEVKGLKVSPDSVPLDFFVKKGEILGVAGMVGSGRTEIANAIVGAARNYGGEIYHLGKKLSIQKPADSIRYKIAFITEDRQRLGLMLGAPVVENLVVVGLQTKIRGAILNVRNFVPMVQGLIEGLKIKLANPMQEVRSLSGGNQQKVVLGKWLFTDSDIFIFDEPTRGIDVNAKSEFYKIISNLAKEGKSIIMISSDMPELISMSDRIMVVRNGKITTTLEKGEISENSIIRHALGVNQDERVG